MAAEDSILSICPRFGARLVGQCKDTSRDTRPRAPAEGVVGLEAINLKHIAERLKCNEDIGDPGNFAGAAEQIVNPIRVALAWVENGANAQASASDSPGGAA